MKTYTKEERSEYFKALRNKWAANKSAADQDVDAKAKWEAVRKEAPEAKISYYGFYFTLVAMQQQKLEGLPYVDAKTFNGWRSSGFKVRKGETSKIAGITWIAASNDDDDKKVIYPKQYALFHKSQVDAILV